MLQKKIHREYQSSIHPIDAEYGSLRKQFASLIAANKLGMHTPNGFFSASPMSFSPWKMTTRQFESAKQSARAVAEIFLRASENIQFLKDALADYSEEDSLLFRLSKQLNSKTKAVNFNLSRQDFLLDKQQQWRLVESNSIAAGMGPFNETLLSIQQQLSINASMNYAPNPATNLQAKSLFEAAVKLNNNNQPLVVFVIEQQENNVFDQAMLAEGLKRRGAIVVYRTLNQLQQELSSNSKTISLCDYGDVDLFYFRTGYNIKDYNNASQNPDELLKLRTWIEAHKTVVCPTINYQIATSKWIQMKLSDLDIAELRESFGVSQEIAIRAKTALDTEFYIPKSLAEIRSKLSTGNWILKTQNEGGGNVFDQYFDFEQIYNKNTRYILMKKIDPLSRQGTVKALYNDRVINHTDVISELGIFALGERNKYGGYLLRSKPGRQLEAGIHRGGGFLDCVGLK